MKPLLVLLALALVYAATGLHFVAPDELAVVRRFGRVQEVAWEPGAHLGLPWGFDRVDRLKPSELKQVSVGSSSSSGPIVDSASPLFLTGDRNLVTVRATVQFVIRDPVHYLWQSDSRSSLVRGLAESAAADVLSGQSVERVLTRGKQELGILIRDQLQSALDHNRLGVLVRSVDIGSVAPPPEVREAFNDVVAALREKQQTINDANSYSRQVVSYAAAESQRLRDESRAHASRVVNRSQGEVATFRRLLHEYQQAPDLTARRMYLETLAATLPRFRSKLIVATEEGVDLSIVREED